MCLGGYASKNVYKAGKTSALFSGDASGANRCYVVAHCGGGNPNFFIILLLVVLMFDFIPRISFLTCLEVP